MKKALCFLLCAVLALVCAVPVFASGGASLTAEDVRTAAGETFVISLSIKNNSGFCYLKLRFEYDETLLTFVSAENGAVSTDAFSSEGTALQWDSDLDAAGDGVLVRLTFRAKKAGESTVRVRCVGCFNYNENPVSVAEISVKVVAEEKSAAFMPGDVDDDKKITADDARLALRRAVKLEDYAEGSREFKACDVDRDKAVTADDARLILRASVKLEDPTKW